MKKNYFLLFLLMICTSGFSLFAQRSVVVPVEQQRYTIQQSTSRRFLTRASDNARPRIYNFSGNSDQVFVFVPVQDEEGAYWIQNELTNERLVRGESGVAALAWIEYPELLENPDRGKFKIDITGIEETGLVFIRNVANETNIIITVENCLGTGIGAVDDGSEVFTNRRDFDPESRWIIAEFVNGVDKTALRELWESAVELLESTTVGTAPNQFPALARNTFEEYIYNAEDILDDDNATQEEINDMLNQLEGAMQAYRDSVNPLQPDPAATFYIVHSSGMHFTSGYYNWDTNASIQNPTNMPDQQFRFVPVQDAPGVVNIQSVSSGNYVTKNGNGWSVEFRANPFESVNEENRYDLAQFRIVNTGTGFYKIRVVGGPSNNCLGTDSNNPNSGVYLDKSGRDIRHHWKVVNINDATVVKTILEEALNKTNAFLPNAVVGDGSDQYPALEIDALREAKTAAEAVFANPNATQEQVNEAVAPLTAALNAAIASVNPHIIPDVTAKFYIIHSSGLYFDASTTKIENPTKADGQIFQFVSVEDNPAVYNIVSVSTGKLLSKDAWNILFSDEPSADVSQYQMKSTGTGYYTISLAGQGGTCMGTDNTTVGSSIYSDKSGSDSKHHWRIVDITDTGIKSPVPNTAIAFADGKQLKVNNLTGKNSIFIYTITGQLVESAKVNGSEYTKSLQAGAYIVAVKGDSYYRGIVLVK